MSKPLVSIIMPVYNSKKYVKKAAESVLNQDFDQFELIMVDDGSTDGSDKVCDQLALEYSKLVVIHKKNGGMCAARNAGIEAARGDYIGFCDNDDFYKPHLIKDNYLLAKEYDADIMRYSKDKVVERDDGKRWHVISKIEDMRIEKDEYYKHYQNIRREDTVWTGLYKRQLIIDAHIRFNEESRFGGEDIEFNLEVLKASSVLGFNSKSYYEWTQRQSHSTSRSFHPEHIGQMLRCLDKEYEFMYGVCQGRIDKTEKVIFLNNAYVFYMTTYLQSSMCKYSLKQKADVLEKLREKPIFSGGMDKETAVNVKKKSARVYLVAKLFYARKFKLLIRMLDLGESILSKRRYK